jgi:hypothetical protein
MTNKEINNKLDTIINALASMDARITALESSQTVSVKKSTSKKTTSSKKQSAPKSTEPTKAQLDARKAWGEAQHARAEARKELFNIVESAEYQKEWAKWTKSKAYKDASRSERKELNKAKHREIVAKISK